MARTDAIEPEGLKKALKRGEQYLKAGADALYVEGPRDDKELVAVAKEFKGEKLVVTMLEGGGETPWHSPRSLGEMGYSMVLYPPSVIFRVAQAIQRALGDLQKGVPMAKSDAMMKDEFLKVVGLDYRQEVENRFKR